MTSSGEEALALLVAFDSITGRSVRETVELDEIDFCIPTTCGFTEGERVMEIDELVVLGTVLFSTRWFTLNGEGARKETADLGLVGALGEACAVLRTVMLALEFILAFGRTAEDGDGSLLGDGGRLGILRRGGLLFALRGDGGRSYSSLTVTCVAKLAEISGRRRRRRRTFAFTVVISRGRRKLRLQGRFGRWWWYKGKSNWVITCSISTRPLHSSGRISRAYPPPN